MEQIKFKIGTDYQFCSNHKRHDIIQSFKFLTNYFECSLTVQDNVGKLSMMLYNCELFKDKEEK